MMVATPLSVTNRYIHAEATRIYWVVAIADVTAPLRAELDAGVDLTGEVAAIVGWNVRRRVLDAQAAGQDFAAQLDGTLEVDDSRLVLYADEAGVDVGQVLTAGLLGHVVFLFGGDVEANPMNVWPVRVAVPSRSADVVGDGARIDVQFVVIADPGLELSVPAVA